MATGPLVDLDNGGKRKGGIQCHVPSPLPTKGHKFQGTELSCSDRGRSSMHLCQAGCRHQNYRQVLTSREPHELFGSPVRREPNSLTHGLQANKRLNSTRHCSESILRLQPQLRDL